MEKDNLVRSFLGIITFMVLVYAMEHLSAILIPLVVAIIFSIVFNPVVKTLNNKKIPTAISLLLVIFILACSFYLFGTLLYVSSKPLISSLPAYMDKLTLVMTNVLDRLLTVAETLGISVETIDAQALIGATSYTVEKLSGNLIEFLNILGYIGLVLLFLLFMLSGIGSLQAKVIMAFNLEKANQINNALQSIEVQIRKYIAVKILLSGVTGLLTFFLLWILGVDFPLFWGLIAFFVSFIPNIGAVIAIGLPFIFSLLQFDGFMIPILVVLLLGLVYMIMGSLVEPKFMASTLNLSVLLILIALIFWGLLWGLWGMILAIPLTTIIKIIFSNIPSLKPISILMGSKTE